MRTNHYCTSYFLAGLISAAALVAPCDAQAQTVDYGSLQSLFGEPITTSATGTPQKASDAPANMTIITADEIRQSGSRNIAQILSRVPGLDVLQEGFNSFTVGVRGYQQLYQPRLLVLLDGRQVFIDDYSRTIWDNIPVNIDDIRQIEVVKGASSALFGSNAAGGVINIVTYSPVYDKNNVASASLGTQQSLSEDATITENGSWGGTKFSAGGLNAQEFGTPRLPFDDQIPSFDPQHQYFVNSSVFQLTPNLHANTEATYSNSTSNSIDGITYVAGAQKTTTWSARAGFDWQSPYGLITSNNYYNHSFVNFFEFNNGGVPYGITVGLLVSQLQDQFKIGTDHTFRVELEYRHKNFTNTGAEVVPQTPELSENNYAVSGTWLWQVNDKLSWTNAMRVDHEQMDQIGTLAPGVFSTSADYSHVNNTWSANSDIVYKATDSDSFRAGYGRGIQLPSLIQSGFDQIFIFDGFLPADAEGNPHLKPTIVQDLGVDYDRKLASLYSTLKLSTFYEYNQDIVAGLQALGIQTILGNPYFSFISQNVGSSYGWGGEVQLKGSHGGFRWDASYSLARVVDQPFVASTVDYQGSAPEHHFRLLFGYTTGPWDFDANGQYVTPDKILRSVDGGVTSSPISTSGYESLSGRIGYKVNDHITLALSGANLAQTTTHESPYPAVERQVFLNLTGKF